MGLADRIDRHAMLFHRMADTVNADLGDALIDGRIDGQGMRAAVFQCMTCEKPEACPGWMDAHPEGATEAPDFCRNKALLKHLSA